MKNGQASCQVEIVKRLMMLTYICYSFCSWGMHLCYKHILRPIVSYLFVRNKKNTCMSTTSGFRQLHGPGTNIPNACLHTCRKKTLIKISCANGNDIHISLPRSLSLKTTQKSLQYTSHFFMVYCVCLKKKNCIIKIRYIIIIPKKGSCAIVLRTIVIMLCSFILFLSVILYYEEQQGQYIVVSN